MFNYLESDIAEDGRSLVYMKSGIALAKNSINNGKELLTRGLSKKLKIEWQKF